MDAFKIICFLLFCSYCEGYFISRNYNNRYSQVFPSFNFQTFPEYFKPLYRIKYLTPTSTTKRIQTHTPNPTEITNTKKLIVPSKQRGNGLLSLIKNVKPFKEMMKNQRERVKKPMTGFDTMYGHQRNHALHLKLIPKMIKKEVEKQLGTILRKMPKDKSTNDKKYDINKTKGNKVEAIDITNNKDDTSSKHDKLKEINLDEIKTKTAYINKLEAKSIFGNFVGNKHFANIFIFYPNNDNSAVVVGLKDNITNVFTKNPLEISTKNPIDHLFDKTTENGIEESLVTKHDDHDLDGNKDHESSNDKSDNTTVSTGVIVTTDNIILTSDATASTTSTTKNQDKDNKNTDNDENDLFSNKDNVHEVSKDDESESTKDFSITSTSISSTTELFHTNSDHAIVVNELTENPSEDSTEKLNDKKDEELVVATSTVANEVTESSYENLKDVEHGIKDDEIVNVQGSNEFKDPIKDNDVDSTVVPTTAVNQVTETTSENLTEKLNETKDEIVKEEYIHDQVTDKSTVVPDDSTVVPDESTVVPDESIVTTDTTSEASAIKDNYVNNTEVPSTTESHIEATSDSEFESNPSDNTTEATTIDLRETTTTAGGESTIENDNSLEDTTDDDFDIEIEYTYF